MIPDITPILALGALLLQPVRAANTTCSRAALQDATARYIAAQSTGQVQWLQKLLASNVTYIENGKAVDFGHGMLSQSVKIDRSRSIYDTVTCATFTELIASDPADPHVIGTQMRYQDGKVIKIDSIATGVTDWLFNASHTLHYALGENWRPIPRSRRDSREAIQAAGDAYFDYMKNQNVSVPWGSPCVRLEGGAYTGRGYANDTCNIGIPPGSNMSAPDRRYVIDQSVGVVSILTYFGGLGNAPDSHEFRVEEGKLRYIHTMTYCGSKVNCGLTRPAIIGQDVGF